MPDNYNIESKFNYLGIELLQQIMGVSDIKKFPNKMELIREGQYVKVIPIVLNGLVKVYTQFEDKELLLYYVRPEQSCIMSFSSCLKNEKSKIFAVTEEESTILLIPSDKVASWVTEFPTINKLFYQQYDLRYSELIDTINHLLFYKLDRRLLDYLTKKINVTGKNPIKVSHKEIANELGTAREVVSRLVKKLEGQNKLKQHHDSIELFFA
jgi:CRP/FNR family transcriptional regulator, anaerobic regulatory protein